MWLVKLLVLLVPPNRLLLWLLLVAVALATSCAAHVNTQGRWAQCLGGSWLPASEAVQSASLINVARAACWGYHAESAATSRRRTTQALARLMTVHRCWWRCAKMAECSAPACEGSAAARAKAFSAQQAEGPLLGLSRSTARPDLLFRPSDRPDFRRLDAMPPRTRPTKLHIKRTDYSSD